MISYVLKLIILEVNCSMKKRKIIIFIIFTVIFSIGSFLFSYGNDYYWHVKIGEYIFKSKTTPYIDIFSWYGSVNKLRWISHEWLSEVIIFLFSNIFGQNGAFIYVFIMILILGVLIFIINKSFFYKNSFYAVVWAIFGLLIISAKALPRPHLFSYLLFTVTLILAYDLYKNKDSNKIYLSLLISILWSNLHGGSSNLSYIIYGIFLFCSIFPNKNYKKITNKNISPIQRKKYIIAIILSLIGICINPHGLIMLLYPYQNMTYTDMIRCISEWHRISIFKIDGIFYLIFIGYITLKLIRTKKKISLVDLILFVSFTIISIKSIKFVPYLYISSSFYIFNYFNKERNINIYILFIFILLIYGVIIVNYEIPKVEILQEKTIKYIKKHNKSKLYNEYDIGGYLIYKDIKPFIDSRADLYISTIFSDNCNMELNNPKIIEKYNFDLFLVSKNSNIYNYLSKRKSIYKTVINDKDYVLIKK